MNYKGKKVALTGHAGFIGSKVLRALQDAGAEVMIIQGDIRQATTFRNLGYQFDYLFHFAAPSSQILFKRQPMYAADVTLRGFINAAKMCKENGIKLIYPSTGLLSQNKFNEYAMLKKICEDIHLGENLDAIGIRIFASYGPGEDHKRDFASVPFLFARDMVQGKQPVIYGDGQQKRDFVYIDDVVDGILHIAEEQENGVYDLGSGTGVTFNVLVELINEAIGMGPNDQIEAVYIEKPGGYIDETLAKNSVYKATTSISDGVEKMVKDIRRTYGKSNSNDND